MDGDFIATGATDAFACVISGTVGGLIIGLVTEYYTSHSYAPVREVSSIELKRAVRSRTRFTTSKQRGVGSDSTWRTRTVNL